MSRFDRNGSALRAAKDAIAARLSQHLGQAVAPWRLSKDTAGEWSYTHMVWDAEERSNVMLTWRYEVSRRAWSLVHRRRVRWVRGERGGRWEWNDGEEAQERGTRGNSRFNLDPLQDGYYQSVQAEGGSEEAGAALDASHHERKSSRAGSRAEE